MTVECVAIASFSLAAVVVVVVPVIVILWFSFYIAGLADGFVD